MISPASTTLIPPRVPGRAASTATATAVGPSSRDYWLFQLAGWGGLAILGIATTQGSTETVIRFGLAKTACMVSGFCLTHLWRLFLRRKGWIDRNGDFPARAILSALVLLSLAQTGVLLLADLAFRGGDVLSDPAEVPSLLVAIFILWYAVFLLWTLCYAVVLTRRRAIRFELEKLELEVSVKDAELRALQAQINPHFFFNSLNSIRALIYQDPDSAAQAVGQLGGMMRHSLRAGQVATVRLADEMVAVNAYLGMEKFRFDERLQASVDIEAGLEDVAIPPMSLQTLVENAVKHGVEPSMGVCQVRIEARRADGRVVLTVANQGWLAAASASTRLGLANTSKRLALLFGPDASCTLAEHAGWVVATIVLPQEPA